MNKCDAHECGCRPVTEMPQVQCVSLDDVQASHRRGWVVIAAGMFVAISSSWFIERLVEVHPGDVYERLLQHEEEIDARLREIEAILTHKNANPRQDM